MFKNFYAFVKSMGQLYQQKSALYLIKFCYNPSIAVTNFYEVHHVQIHRQWKRYHHG